MTAFFQETFTGTAFDTLDAKAPDVGSNTWVDNGGSSTFLLDGTGYAFINGSGADTAGARIDFGGAYPDELVLDFSFLWAAPSELNDSDDEHDIFSISVGVSRVVTAILTRGRMYLPDDPGTPVPYHKLYLRVENELFEPISTEVQYVGDLADATHSGSLTVKDGFQKLDFLGLTLLADTAYDVSPPALRFFSLFGIEGMIPDAISADIQALGAFDVITESFSDLVLGDAQGENYATAESEIVYGSVAVQSGSITSPPVFSAIAFSGSASSVVSANTSVSSNLQLASVVVGFDSPSSSALELNSIVPSSLIQSSIESNLALGSVAASILQAFSNIESALVFGSIVESGPATLESALVFGSIASSVNATVSSVSSSIELGSTATATAQIGTTSSSNLVFGSEVQSNLAAVTSVESHISFSSRSTYDVLLQAWTMNSQTHAMSRYNGLPYRSIAAIGNRLIALGDTGFFELDSDADNGVPIDAMYVTGFEKLGTDKLKRLGNVFIGYSTKNPVSVLVREYGDTKLSYTYNLPTRTADAPRGGKVTLGKGLRSKYYQFTIKGQSLNLDYAQVEVFASENRKV